MKKIAILMLLIAASTLHASALKIILQGGTTKHTYDRVVLTKNLILCKGSGTNNCPVKFSAVGSMDRQILVSDIINYVATQVDAGKITGSARYDKVLPISWTASDRENMEVDIEAEQFIEVKGNEL